jgi:hypothetical protein
MYISNSSNLTENNANTTTILEHEKIYPYQLLIISTSNRIITTINILFYVLLAIVYIRRKTITFIMYIHIQLCIIHFLEDITFYFPLIKTLELEQSLFCKLQAILQFISTYGTFCMFITILIITYYSYYHHETLQLKGFRIQLI